jgi:class 3 adenylate cyclase/tetratricopeptide (TPR) repeat protein
MCPSCGAETRPGQKFCADCGAALQRSCPTCGTPYEGSPKFCAECGSALAAANGAAPAAAAAAPQAAQAPDEATENGAAVAERRLVSVMFADLVGFTSMSEARDAEAVREQLTEYFGVAQEIVGRYGGTVEKFIGDAVMAVWGTPVAHEDDAERAVRAALDLVDAVKGLRTLGVELQARAGVLTGDAAVTIGATNQGMVAGDLVNTASRLQAIATAGHVLVGEETYRAASGAIVFEPVGEQELRGKSSPVPAYRAMRVVAKRGGAGRAEQLEAPFLGRDTEMRLVRDLFHATPREKRPRLVSVIGQAGIGKSRLAWEFQKYIDGLTEQIRWHQGRSPAYGDGISYWALGEMVRSRCELLENDDDSTTRIKLAAALERWVPDEGERRRITPPLEQLLGISQVEAGTRDELFSAWRTFFERVIGEGTGVLVFEDLHWADSGLLDFIDHLMEWSRGSAIFIVTLARPELLERRPNWGAGHKSFTSLPLEPLPDEVIRQILQSLVPGLPDPLVDQILARAEGVPLYAVETVRMLQQDGHLEAAGGAYRLVGDVSTLAVPASLHALIAARLDALDQSDRYLLQRASVLGQTFTEASLAALMGGEELETRLRSLVRRELLVHDVDPRSPELGQYGFVQALVRDVAYSTLARRDRKSAHLEAARYFESLGLEEIVDAVAAHYLDAYLAAPDEPDAEEVRALAVEKLRHAAERAAGLGSHELAVRLLDRALEITPDEGEQSRLLERAGAAAGTSGRYEIAEGYLRRAIETARSADRPIEELRAAASLGYILANAGRMSDAISAITESLERHTSITDDPVLVTVWADLARAYMMHGDYDRAIEWCDRALPVAEHRDMVREIADLLVTRGTAVSFGGRVREGIAVLRGALHMARAYALPRVVARGETNLVGSLVIEDPADAWHHWLDIGEEVRATGRRDIMSTIGVNAVLAAMHAGAWDAAYALIAELLGVELDPADRNLLEGAATVLGAMRGVLDAKLLASVEEYGTASSETELQAQLAGILGQVAFAEGRYAEAQRQSVRAVELSLSAITDDLPRAAMAAVWAGDATAAEELATRLRSVGFHGRALNAQLRMIDGAVAALRGRRDEAAVAYREAIRAWKEMGALFDLALAELDFVHFVGGETPEIEAAANEARAIFTDLGAKPFLERLDEAAGIPATRE